MSNALAGALWGMDYMLEMAARGCHGINLHGGGGSVISSALGDKLPGARNARDLEIAKLGTFYSPVAGNPEVGYSARPIFYAMLAVQQFAGSTLVSTEFATGDVNATAYAARAGSGWRIALVNKDLGRDLRVSIELPAATKTSELWRLSAPTIDSTEHITLAANEITGVDAQWSPRAEKVRVKERNAVIDVPRASAAVVFAS
jgi:hypothetical protein